MPKIKPTTRGVCLLSWKNALLVLAITLHNIPEGLSIGVAFGGVVSGNSHATF